MKISDAGYGKTGYCPCWPGDVSLHDGHCCFRPDAPRNCHREAGEAAWKAAGSPPVRAAGIPDRRPKEES